MHTIALSALMVIAAAAPAFNTSAWQYRRAFMVPPGPSEYVEVRMDADLYARAAPDFRDIRIASPAGAQVPYVIRERRGGVREETISTSILNRSVSPGRVTRIEFDVPSPRPHNRLRLEIAGGEFSRRVTLEGSDDRREWFVLTTGLISRLPQGAEATTLAYPDSTYRYVRVTIHDRGESPLDITGAALVFSRTIPRVEDRWFAGPVRAQADPQDRTTTVTIDTGHRGVPLSRLLLEISQPATFVRDGEVSVGDDGQAWRYRQSIQMARPKGAAGQKPLQVDLRETRGRFIRLTLFDGDNPPLAITAVQVYGIRRTILFPAAGGGTYWMYQRNPEATIPQYDLPRLLDVDNAPPNSVEAVLGPLEPNPAYLVPVIRRPWSEEHPLLLWGTIGVSIVVLAALILRTVRHVGQTSQDDR